MGRVRSTFARIQTSDDDDGGDEKHSGSGYFEDRNNRIFWGFECGICDKRRVRDLGPKEQKMEMTRQSYRYLGGEAVVWGKVRSGIPSGAR